tara:strand:- start:10 stop:525 length:516 start_codon:yes stop_codon:yes gene_type:complete
MEFFIDNIIYIALISTILISVFLFFKYQKNKDNNPRHLMSRKMSSQDFELKLRAYERLTVFLERIEPIGMVNRLELHNLDVSVVQSTLIKNIVIEYEYNVSQQIYISDKLWEVIGLVKNKIINNIASAVEEIPEKGSTELLVQILLRKSKENTLIINHAKTILKQELRSFS